MLSQKNKYLNEHVIPKLLREHAVSLSSDPDFVDLSTAENNLVKPELLNIINEPDSHPALTASVSSFSTYVERKLTVIRIFPIRRGLAEAYRQEKLLQT